MVSVYTLRTKYLQQTFSHGTLQTELQHFEQRPCSFTHFEQWFVSLHNLKDDLVWKRRQRPVASPY